MSKNADGRSRVLVVDDLDDNRNVLCRFLESMGYVAQDADGGESALAMVKESPPDVILLDLMMPGISGLDVCCRLKADESTRHIPIIIITANANRGSNLKAVEAGADDFLTKPFDQVLLEARIRSCIRSKNLQERLIEYNRELEEKVRERTCRVEQIQHAAIFSLAKLAESRDTETGNHLERIRAYARELALELFTWEKYQHEINSGFMESLCHSVPLHDIGKVGIPDHILLKPGPLTPEEYEIMKTHALVGGDTLKAADLEAGGHSFLAMGRDIAYYHHEKWDGSGYPFQLAGTAIPQAARITALADAYDALCSKRPYKEALSHETSREILVGGRGSHFDPDLVDAFLARQHRFDRIREQFNASATSNPPPLSSAIPA